MRASLTFGKVFDIPIGVHSSWFVVFALVTWSLAAGYFPGEYPGWSTATYWLVGLVTSLLFFGSVVAHELGHAVVALREGVQVRGITLFVFGGVAQIGREPSTAGAEFRIAAAGPLVSLLLGLGLSALGRSAGNTAWGASAVYLGRANLLLVGFNLIPGFPLDGGRMLRAVIWALGRDFRSATRVASLVGQGIAFLFILGGVLLMFGGQFFNGLWIAFIGWFLQSAAAQSWQQVEVRDTLRSLRVEQVMNRQYALIEPGLSLEQLVYENVLGSGRRCFFVADQSGVVGMVTLHNIRQVARDEWPSTTVAQAMTTMADLRRVTPRDDLAAVLQRMVVEDVNQMPVMDGGRLLGVVTREDLLRLLQTRAELGI
jgi:Zn-dependent protease/CBS domain-containing protein